MAIDKKAVERRATFQARIGAVVPTLAPRREEVSWGKTVSN
jgi:hypothetical protein